jgi:hypothetical protein
VSDQKRPHTFADSVEEVRCVSEYHAKVRRQADEAQADIDEAERLVQALYREAHCYGYWCDRPGEYVSEANVVEAQNKLIAYIRELQIRVRIAERMVVALGGEL